METDLYRSKFIKVMLLVTVAVMILTMSVMMLYASQKTIVFAEDDIEQTEESVYKSGSVHFDINSLREEDADDIRIRIPSGIGVFDVEVAERYDSCMLTVVIPGGDHNFLLTNSPRGNMEAVQSLYGSFDEDGVVYVMSLTEPRVAQVTYYNKEIGIELKKISDIEEPVVLIDPWHGGSNFGIRAGELAEKDVTLKIARAVRRLSFDKNYKVLLTRALDEGLNTEDRLRAVENTCADIYIGIQLDSDMDDTRKFGLSAVYNPVFYHGGLENVEVADKILAFTATEAKNKALGLYEAGDDELILKAMDIPAAIFYAGFLSNEDEAELLKSDDYIELLAQGIVEGIDALME